MSFSKQQRLETVTTEFVLLELADGLASVARRMLAVRFISALRANPSVTIIPIGADLFHRGLSLYASLPDKDWTLADCTSFVAMQELRLSTALTGDHHFAQAGFSISFAR